MAPIQIIYPTHSLPLALANGKKYTNENGFSQNKLKHLAKAIAYFLIYPLAKANGNEFGRK